MASINKKKLADSVVAEIRNMIERGELAAGEKLPNQHEFASQLGVSRTVLREALQTLTMLGVIEQRPKSGTVIRTVAPLVLADHIHAPLIHDQHMTIELLQARMVVEVGAVELAAQFATEEQIQAIGQLVEEMSDLLEQGDTAGYSERNMSFHLLVAKSSNNRILPHLLATVRGLMERWTIESLSLLPGLFERSLRAHREIYRAIRERDRKKAVSAMRRHINDFMVSVEQYYESIGEQEKTSGQ